MKHKTLFFGIAALSALFFASATVNQPLAAHADFGPKPSTTINIEGMEAVDSYYVALLSKTDDGPYQTVTTLSELSEYRTTTSIDEKLLSYLDEDGFLYTTRHYFECHGNQTVEWGYYPPDPFKAVFYLPTNDAFVVTPELQRTVFETYFVFQLSGEDYLALAGDAVALIPETSISHPIAVLPMILGILVRLVITLVLELGLAWVFKFRSKKQLLCIFLANVVTQLGINIGMNLFELFKGGGFSYWLIFVFLEMLVFIAEALFYHFFFAWKSRTDSKNFHSEWALTYAFFANLLSMGVGLLLSLLQDFGFFF